MNVYRYSFPISNYNDDGIFTKHIYTKGERSLDFDELKALLIKIIKDQHSHENAEYGASDYEECLECLSNLIVSSHIPVLSGYFVGGGNNVNTKFGIKPLSIDKIDIHSFPKSDREVFEGMT